MKRLRYAGIGSRETPKVVLFTMGEIARELNKRDWVLRSGHARGADRAFEAQAGAAKEIFTEEDATKDAIRVASKHHPNWTACSLYARRLHGRNAMILLGEDLRHPVEFVCCWTQDGKLKGGTATGLRIADTWEIPIYNLAIPGEFEKLREERLT